jgi:hypothetical protein
MTGRESQIERHVYGAVMDVNALHCLSAAQIEVQIRIAKRFDETADGSLTRSAHAVPCRVIRVMAVT